MPIKLTIDDAIEAEKELCARSFPYFVRRSWSSIIPDRLQWNWHIDAIGEHLQAVSAGQITRLVINVPPGTSKSTLCGVMFPSWLWGPAKKPGSRFIGASHEQNIAVRDNRNTRELITSEWYSRRWPVELTSDQNEKLYFENKAKGFRQACAVASMTGRRGHIILWDDPLSPEKAHSEPHRKTALRVFSETLPTRLNDPISSAIVVVMQRLHDDDPSGHILRSELGYEHLCIPMEFDPARRKTTSIGWTDPRKDDGELLDPIRFPPEVIARDKAAMGSYGWAGQMQQRPAPAGGGIFKDEWWQYYKALPVISWRAIYADTAQKVKEQNDYSVLQCWGKTADGRAVLIDQLRGKWEAPELLKMTISFWQKHKAITGCGELRALKVEDKSSGTALIQLLKKQSIPIPVIGIPRNTDKVLRSHDAVPYIESGRVLIPEDAPWLSDYLAEFRSFPNASHDDQIDPTIDAINDMLSQPSYNLANVR